LAAVVHQLVVGGAEDLVAGVGAEAGLVDQRLRVLDAEADREGLGLDINALFVQHLEGVAGAVADGQHDVVGGDGSPRRVLRRAPGRWSSMISRSTLLPKRISPPSR
jgi:hypothetical protein